MQSWMSLHSVKCKDARSMHDCVHVPPKMTIFCIDYYLHKHQLLFFTYIGTLKQTEFKHSFDCERILNKMGANFYAKKKVLYQHHDLEATNAVICFLLESN